MTSRRSFLALSAVALGSCGRRLVQPFEGFSFVANRAGKAIAVVDLGVFAVARHIHVNGSPTEVVSHPAAPAVYALTPDSSTVHEIDTDTLALSRSVGLGARPVRMKLGAGGESLWVICEQPRQLVRVVTAEMRVADRVRLPGVPLGFDISPDGARAAVGLPSGGRVAMVDLASATIDHAVQAGASSGELMFRSDGQQVLVADPDQRMLNVLDAASGRLVVRLPLAVRPEHMCVGAQGGQMFITGEGMDAVVAVYPYQTQVAATILAGRAPGFVAATDTHLFVTNPEPGDVTILDLATQRVIAAVSVGQQPGFVITTPDNRFALVLSRQSGDMAVIRIDSLAGRRTKSAPLFMMVPVGSEPVSATVRPV